MKSVLKLILFSIILAAACKKKQTGGRVGEVAASADKPIANAFVVKSAIAIYDAPEDRAKALATLPIGSKIDVFQSRVPDKKIPDKAFWYKVKYSPLTADAKNPQAPVEGFVSEREEVLRDNLMVFEAKTELSATKETAPGKFEDIKEPLAVIVTTSLNLRKSPALNAAVIRTLQNGEVLNVLEQSSKSVEINKRRAHWYLLADEKGEKGYAFGGFLLEGGKGEMLALKNAGFQFSSGWIQPVAKEAKIFVAATGAAMLQISDADYRIPSQWHETKGALQPGAWIRIDGSTTKGATQRYRIVHRRQVEGDYFETDYYYVDKKVVKFVKDYFSVSKDLPHEMDAELAQEVNTYLGGDLNAQCSKVVEFEGGPAENPRRFKAILAAIGASRVTADKDDVCSYTERQTVFSEVSLDKTALFRSAANGEFRDLDGDKIPELVSQGGGRGYWTLEVYSVKPGKVVQIAALGNSMDGGSSDERLNFGYANITDQGLLEIGAPQYVCESTEADAQAQCAKDTAAIVKRAAFLKFDKKLKPFPFYGQLKDDKFVQVAKPADIK